MLSIHSKLSHFNIRQYFMSTLNKLQLFYNKYLNLKKKL